jgi:hypothetical protein
VPETAVAEIRDEIMARTRFEWHRLYPGRLAVRAVRWDAAPPLLVGPRRAAAGWGPRYAYARPAGAPGGAAARRSERASGAR